MALANATTLPANSRTLPAISCCGFSIPAQWNPIPQCRKWELPSRIAATLRRTCTPYDETKEETVMPLFIFSRTAVAFLALVSFSLAAFAQNPQDCSKLPDYNKLKSALTNAVKEGKGANGGLGNQEWGTVVNRDGVVCAVVFTGPNRGAQWPGSRLISAEKANTANAFSTDNFALSSGNVYSAAQPGNSLYSIVSGPNPNSAFAGDPQKFGQPDDPLVGKPVGGVIVFAGGLALYDKNGRIVGGLGV